MNANDLKEYIINNNLTQQILESLECEHIKEYNTEWRSALPHKQNKTAICIKKETLKVDIRSGDGHESGDIYTLVMYIKNISFGKSVRYVHEVLGLKYEYVKNNTNKDNISDPLQIFKKVKRKRHIINKDTQVYNDDCLKEYVKLPYIDWIKEGIMPFACDRFNIGYSYDRKRIVIPERKWDGEENEYIGISGRTTVNNYEMFDIPKYFKLSNTYPKGDNLYGLNENYKSIQNAGYVELFESQKSVLKRYSRKDETGCAMGNCELTEEQVRILISLDVEIIVVLDEGISLFHIRKQCENFYKIRNVSYIYDKWGLLKSGSKDSPADLPNKQFNFMLKHRVKYDEHEHNLYIEELNKRESEASRWQERQRQS